MADLPITVDARSHEAPFEQVRAQLAGLITSGRLLPGDRLPTVRALAAELGLAVNTVARAFKELEASGLVETRSRAGTVVASGEHTADVAVAALATKFAVAAREAGLDDDAAIDLVRSALRARLAEPDPGPERTRRSGSHAAEHELDHRHPPSPRR